MILDDRPGPGELSVALRCGTLHLRVDRADLGMNELCGFASRRSRKRGFVFVSKVLGKHYPVRPHVMTDIHDRLSAKLTSSPVDSSCNHSPAPLAEIPGPVVLIAMAETAIGLGQGVYESWLRRSGRSDVLFLHSTRYRLNQPLALDFEESHSHATAHLVYEPNHPDLRRLFRQAATLVLVDDELSTGRTLVNVAVAYRRLNPKLAEVHLLSLTDWLGPDRRREIAREIGVPTTCHSLLQGSFALTEDARFDPGPIPDVIGRGDTKDAYLADNYGRLGVAGPLALDLDRLIAAARVPPGKKVLVLGSAEFVHPPFLLARQLELRGWDVHFQSTTRSPLLVDRDLTSVLEFLDNYHDAIPNYVYNVADRHYDQVLIGYETRPLPAEHSLPEVLGATPVYFGPPVAR